MEEVYARFGFKQHKVVGSTTAVSMLRLCTTFLALFTGTTAMLSFIASLVGLVLMIAICYVCRGHALFEDSEVPYTNTLFIVSQFTAVVLLQAIIPLALHGVTYLCQ